MTAPAKKCPFCHPRPEEILAEGALALAILDNYPVNPGHGERHLDVVEQVEPLGIERSSGTRPTRSTSASTTAPSPGSPCRTSTCT